MKPHLVCVPFVGDSVGGSHISAVTLLGALDPAHFSHQLVVHRPGPLAEFLATRSLSFAWLPAPRLLGESRHLPGHLADAMAVVPSLVGYLRRLRPDVVYTHDLRMHLSWGLAARIIGIRHVWHQRSRWPASRLMHLGGYLPQRFVAISDFTRSTMPAALRARAAVVINPVRVVAQDRDAARRALLAELGAPDGTRLVGFVGNMTAQKRPKVFLEAAAHLLQRFPALPLRFVLVGADRGGGAGLDHLLSDLMLRDCVHFLGFRYPVEPVMAAMDVLLAPAVEEAFGRTLIEAMQLGTAVVASDSGGHREIVRHGDNGLLVPPDDAVAAAQAVASLLCAGEGLERIQAAGRVWALAACRPEIHARTMTAILLGQKNCTTA